MKTCLGCMTTTLDDSLETCRICGGNNFKSGRPKEGYKIDTDAIKETKKSEIDNIKEKEENIVDSNGQYSVNVTTDKTTSSWIVTFIVLSIPIVGVIYAIIKMTKEIDTTIKNYYRAWIIMFVASLIVSALLSSVLAGFIKSMMYSLY